MQWQPAWIHRTLRIPPGLQCAPVANTRTTGYCMHSCSNTCMHSAVACMLESLWRMYSQDRHCSEKLPLKRIWTLSLLFGIFHLHISVFHPHMYLKCVEKKTAVQKHPEKVYQNFKFDGIMFLFTQLCVSPCSCIQI